MGWCLDDQPRVVEDWATLFSVDYEMRLRTKVLIIAIVPLNAWMILSLPLGLQSLFIRWLENERTVENFEAAQLSLALISTLRDIHNTVFGQSPWDDRPFLPHLDRT